MELLVDVMAGYGDAMSQTLVLYPVIAGFMDDSSFQIWKVLTHPHMG
jgi:hypothetical protein